MIDTERIVKKVSEGKIIAILRGMPVDKLLPVADALYEGGIRMIECTFDHSREDCIEANCKMISQLVEHFEGRMDVGAGTVLTVEEVEATVKAGGSFIISPSVDEAVIKKTRELGAVSMPGALTPTEIVNAWKAGAHYVKIFPAGDLGAGYVKSVRAPLKHIPMLAVGGITPENIPDYLACGVSGFGVGSPLLPKADIEKGNYAAITERAAKFIAAAR